MNFYQATEALMNGHEVTNEVTGHVYKIRKVITFDGIYSEYYPTDEEIRSDSWKIV